MILSPKTRFQNTQDVKVHAEIVVQESFRRATDYAMLELLHQQTTGKDQYLDAAVALRIAGARQYLSILMELSEPPKLRRQVMTDNLQHNL